MVLQTIFHFSGAQNFIANSMESKIKMKSRDDAYLTAYALGIDICWTIAI